MSACSSSDNETTIDLSANGGTASSDASGDGNVAGALGGNASRHKEGSSS